jgi:hypothetical protein
MLADMTTKARTTGATGAGTAGPAARKPAPAKAATPWGAAVVVEEVKLAQRAGDKRFGSVVQLLETGVGERLVRIAYTTDGTARRGPVTLRARDLDRLRAALISRPALAAALGLPGGDA